MPDRRQPGRQGPPSDPNRDGCGPAVLLVLAASVPLVWTVVGLLHAVYGS